ncbi:hypothetical protein N9874_00040 [Akkermansiaceae bacterium]|nr:hypothetical protein [Akkermansiaceae bacterium]MDB4286736.1 hypothetical protein [Akkermansiaceae bacterium]MDB4596901.1 hypothetical protein [Akkermansiaceae bacterium]MDB4659170.1 hypothetical protein [Akkermansiaceae bacterium]MDB4722588.1 hypothetical protein [Akkermansiaceae bacterium]
MTEFKYQRELQTFGVKEWQEAGDSARRAAAWEIVVDDWVNQKGKHPDELRMKRVITSFKRGKN